MANYRDRLERDLDTWIERSLVPAESRAAILASVAGSRRLDAATALAIIGGLLAGVAVIAFVAANWGAIPRLVRFAIILGTFLAAAGGAAWASARRPVTAQVLLSVSALIFAAAIGLTGQIFDIAGNPQAALRSAGLAALLLGLAGGSPWALAVGLGFIGLGDAANARWSGEARPLFGWLVVAAPLGAMAALRWRSSALAHVSGIAAVASVVTLEGLAGEHDTTLFGASLVLGVLAIIARQVRDRFAGVPGTLYGWLAQGSLLWFGVAGFVTNTSGVPHSLVWMVLAGTVVVLGRVDAHAPLTGAGVIGLLAAGATLLFNLGVGLMTSAVVFGGCAVLALGVAFVLRRQGRAA